MAENDDAGRSWGSGSSSWKRGTGYRYNYNYKSASSNYEEDPKNPRDQTTSAWAWKSGYGGSWKSANYNDAVSNYENPRNPRDQTTSWVPPTSAAVDSTGSSDMIRCRDQTTSTWAPPRSSPDTTTTPWAPPTSAATDSTFDVGSSDIPRSRDQTTSTWALPRSAAVDSTGSSDIRSGRAYYHSTGTTGRRGSSPDTPTTPSSAKQAQPTYKVHKDSNTVVVCVENREYVLTPGDLFFPRFVGYDPGSESRPLDLGWFKRVSWVINAELGWQPPRSGEFINLDVYAKFSVRAVAKWLKNRNTVLKASADRSGPNFDTTRLAEESFFRDLGVPELRWLDFVEVGTCNYNSLSQACYSYLDQSSVAYWVLSRNCLVRFLKDVKQGGGEECGIIGRMAGVPPSGSGGGGRTPGGERREGLERGLVGGRMES